MRTVLAATVLSFSIASLSLSAEADAAIRKMMSVPAQGVGPALQAFAKDRALHVVYIAEDVHNLQSQGAVGNLTVQEALQQILDGTGLTYQRLDDSTVTIFPRAAANAGRPGTPASDKTISNSSIEKGAASESRSSGLLRIAQLDQSAASAGAASSRTADSSTASTSASAPADSALEEVIVTGTARSSGLHRLDAGFSITTVSADDLQKITPLSSADVLKNVPGTYVESSGGVAGLRVNVRGFPMNGGGQFSAIELDGATLFPPMTLSFIEGYSLFRVDDTVERIEVLRGGPSPIFSSGQPGITLNFIQKKGKDETEGSTRLTVGAEGLYRFDGFIGGKITDGWYGTVGGFYRQSDGVRDPQFRADEGGQISGTLTRRFDDGEITFYGRGVKDSNVFFSGAPLLSKNNGKSIDVYPFFDQREDALAGNDTRRLEFEISPGATPGILSTDFSDGRTIDLAQFGASFDFTPGDWAITDRVGYLNGSADTRAIFTSAVPLTLGSYINGRVTATNATAAVVAAAGRTATGGSARYSTSGSAIADLTTPVIVAGFWYVDKDIETFTNDLRVSRTWGDHTVTLGNYFAYHSIQDLWYQGNNALLAFENHARRIDVALNNGVLITKNGFTGYATNNFKDDFDGKNVAFFLADEWELNDRLRIDGGMRVENYKTDGTVNTASNVNLDGNALTFYNNTVSVLNGGVQKFDYEQTENSWTLGANYHLTPRLSAFGRVNSGYRFPTFDEIRVGSRTVQTVDQYEIGLKTAQSWVDAYLTLFYNEFVGQTYTQQVVNPSTGAITDVVAIAGSEARGAELEGTLRPFGNFSLGFNATYFDAEYTGVRNGAPTGVQNGNEVSRSPSVQVRVSPAYEFDLAHGELTLFGAYTHVGARYSDIQNFQKLLAYDTFDMGLSWKLNAIEAQLTGTNLTNELALTEGNARIVGTTDAAVIGRAIFGRSYQASILYRF